MNEPVEPLSDGNLLDREGLSFVRIFDKGAEEVLAFSLSAIDAGEPTLAALAV